ncbi:MAG: hypothetical protein Q7U52_04385 [Hydrogenophaga sp.]|nr:hypothetical protein [Hydrogenophaga sp.]MDO9146893.1 hypothetical protein [Hydrogenophaga sp.]MDO9605848.1 hypothetical protein [Hydrogenophaga sp.]
MHKELSKRTGVAVYFYDPDSPWQRGSNENTFRVKALQTRLSRQAVRWPRYSFLLAVASGVVAPCQHTV